MPTKYNRWHPYKKCGVRYREFMKSASQRLCECSDNELINELECRGYMIIKKEDNK